MLLIFQIGLPVPGRVELGVRTDSETAAYVTANCKAVTRGCFGCLNTPEISGKTEQFDGQRQTYYYSH